MVKLNGDVITDDEEVSTRKGYPLDYCGLSNSHMNAITMMSL